MGYSILMQWNLAGGPPPPGRMGISDLVLSRILEHYNISHPMRSTIQLRTFRASFPAKFEPESPQAPVSTTRVLTTITHSLPIPHARDVTLAPGARDNVTYLFLEDRGVRAPPPPPPPVSTNGADAADMKDDSKAADDGKEVKEEKDKAKMEEDGFEIVEKKDDSKDGDKDKKGDEPMAVDSPSTAAKTPAAPPSASKYKIIAVKPATAVMPTLQHLLSPFVLGLNKSARAAASTTAQVAAPTSLQGTPLMLTTLGFPPVPHPQPAITLNVHILPNAAAQTIFLEAEWDGTASIETSRAILKEFLLGCIPAEVAGEPRFMYWEDSGAPGAAETPEGLVENQGWHSVERTRRITFLLTKALRESQFI